MKTIQDSGKNQSPDTCQLKPADILLIHTKHNLWGRIIRFATHCYWNHALMVYSPGNSEKNNKDTLVIDARTDGKIVFRAANEFFDRPNKYDVAVKRLEKDWFSNGQSTSATDIRRYVCNIALDEVDIEIGMPLGRLIDQFIRQFTVILRFIRRKIGLKYIPNNLPLTIKPEQLKAFTCGGFVQWCYYTAVSRVMKEESVERLLEKEIIFNPRIKDDVTSFELLTTTPADLANCHKLSWKYIIKSGVMGNIPQVNDSAILSTST